MNMSAVANTLYISHIPASISLTDLHEMLKQDGLTITRIKYFDMSHRMMLECPDQSVADRIIDKYNGRVILGCRLKVEPWVEFTPVLSVRKRSLVRSFIKEEDDNMSVA